MKAIWPVDSDVFHRRVQTIGYRTIAGLGPKGGPGIVGVAAEQQTGVSTLGRDDGR
ncbi:hypothetical protein [Hymenobacter volaticus]|uniref:hypothetical protein n=1 Tax=Hymenobacter volaticus TaxID=2932254 RepID=UPI0028801B12|nr:hypothetical protein [Hymenobacter volaticus]